MSKDYSRNHRHARAYKSRHERGYGAAWVRLRRLALIRDNYLCRHCLEQGRPTPAQEVDHITRKADGGEDNLDNLQSLCSPCHKEKTRAENREHNYQSDVRLDGWSTERTQKQPFSIPRGVKKSAIPVTLVCGPPASGKSTYIQQHAQEGDVIVDLDEIKKSVGGVKWDVRDEIWRKAWAKRDEIIRGLHTSTARHCWLIVTAPTTKERNAWKRALGKVTVKIIWTRPEECIERIRATPERHAAAEEQIAAVLNWWEHNGFRFQ